MSLSQDSAIREELTAVATLGDKLKNVVAAAAKLGPAGSLAGLARRISQEVGVNEAKLRDALSCIWNLGTLCARTDKKPDELVQSFVDQLDEEWMKRYGEQWNLAKPILINCLKSIDQNHPIFISIKANQLAYSQERLLVGSRLVTDIRPVFDTDAKKILETVITHTLAIQYTDGFRDPAMMSFALDLEDIQALREACDRAVRKSEIVRHEMRKFKPVVLPEP